MSELTIEGAELVGSGRRIPVATIAAARVVRVEPDNAGAQTLLMVALILFGVGVRAVFRNEGGVGWLIGAGVSFAAGILLAHRQRPYHVLEVQLPGELVRLGHEDDGDRLEHLAALLAPARGRASA